MRMTAAALIVSVAFVSLGATAMHAFIRYKERSRDWAGLSRYREANRALLSGTAGEERVVFMGDSIFDAWPQPRFGNFFVGKPYISRGIVAQTTPQMLVRFRADVIDLKPAVVVILAGTNDIAGNTGPATNEEIQGNLASMCELASVHGVHVVLASILPVSAYHTVITGTPRSASRPLARIRAINEWMKQYAARERHVYLDYFSVMVDGTGVLREDFSDDDLHPNAKGYGIMAGVTEAAIGIARHQPR
jgi:lysophospholipase L1-like esterase